MPARPSARARRTRTGAPSSSPPQDLCLLRRSAGARRRRPHGREGQLVGLIGPNGAGKTTFIDAISGFVPYRGRVELDGRRLDGLAAHRRAERGLARTWQSLELFDDLSVRENLAVASYRPSALGDDQGGPLAAGHEHGAAEAALELLGLDVAGGRDAGRAHAGPAQAGRYRACARGAAAAPLPRRAGGGTGHAGGRGARTSSARVVDAGTPMLLVDHDMGLVLGISDYVVVLEFGRVIAHGHARTSSVATRR